MRVLDTTSKKLVEFDQIPHNKYAILSHTWRVPYRSNSAPTKIRDIATEVTYDDMKGNYNPHRLAKVKKDGWKKLEQFCDFAKRNGHQYAWMDTCCINKNDPLETKYSIHGMWEFYAYATVCYAYIFEVDKDKSDWPHALDSASWFKRGWTLQELLAPKELYYVDQNWKIIGSRRELGAPGTGLRGLLQGGPVKVPMPNNMLTQLSWASTRNTTLLEDQAYSICGLLQIKIHVDYEEGKRAFLRLQGDLLGKYRDLSILAWYSNSGIIIVTVWCSDTSNMLTSLFVDINARYTSRHLSRYGEEPPRLGLLAPSIDYFYKAPRANWMLTGRWAGQQGTTVLEVQSSCLRVQTDVFQVELAFNYFESLKSKYSSKSELKYVVQLLHDRETDRRVGILVVPDPTAKGLYVRKFHDQGLLQFKFYGSKAMPKGILGPGIYDEKTWTPLKIQKMNVKEIHLSYY